MTIIMLIVSIIFDLIKLWLSLKSPTIAAEYKDRVDAIVARARLCGPNSKDVSDLLSIRDEIKARFSK